MKNKIRKRRLLPVLIALGVFALVGGTIAVSQDRSILNNLFHLKSGKTYTEDITPPASWKRCDESPKEVSTTNESTFPIRVRLSYDEYWLAADDTTYLPVAPGGNRLTTINLQNQNDWEDGNDGWMYWKGTLAPGASTRSLLKSVTYNCDSGVAVETICQSTPTGTVCEQPVDPYEDASYHVFVTVQTTEENGQFPDETYFDVSIDPNGGEYNGSSSVYTGRVRRGTTLDLTNISYTAHELVDWTLNGTTSYSSSVITINENTTLVANWQSSILYNVTVDPNGGTYDGSTTPTVYQVGDGATYNILEVTRPNYAFDHWEYGDGTTVSGNSFVVTGDTTITANWLPAVARIERTSALYPSIARAEAAAETGDVITLLTNTTETVTNTKTVTLDLNSHTVTGSITNTGNLTLINGEINNPSGAAVTNNGTLTMGVNDYKQDGSANILNDNIRLIGTTVGLQQNSVFNFYDGYIEGDVALAGGYNAAPFYHNVEHDTYIYYYPFISHNDVKDCQHAELASADNSVSKTTVGGDIYYLNLQDNINTSAVTGYKIYAVRNFQASYPVTVAANAEIEFDVAGYDVNISDTLTNNGKLTVTNGSALGKILASQTVVNNGEMIIRNAEITGTTTNDTISNAGTLRLRSGTLSASADGYVFRTVSGSTLDMDANSYISTTSTSKAAVYNITNDFSMSGGNITAPYIGIEGANGSAFTMTGGTIAVQRGDGRSNYGIYCTLNCNVTLKGNSAIITGNLTATAIAYNTSSVYSYGGGGTLIMEDNASITANVPQSGEGISNFDNVTLRDNATINVSGGNASGVYSIDTSLVIEANSNVIINVSSNFRATGIAYSNATINGGTITVTNNSSYAGDGAVGVDYGGSNYVLINGGTITAANTGIGYAAGLAGGNGSIWSAAGEVRGGNISATTVSGASYGIKGGAGGSFTMSGGTVSSETDSGTSYGAQFAGGTNTVTGGTISGETYGIEAGNATVTLGVDDNTTPSTTTPEISGGDYGIYNGSFNFYDGRLKGGLGAYQAGVITNVPDATIVHTETIDGVVNGWLSEAANYLEVNGTPYNSLTKAYNAITGNSGTITVIDDARVEATHPTSPDNKSIIFDLNGHELTYTQTITISDTGTLTIADGSNGHTGKLINPSTYIVTNNGTLNIQSGTLTSSDRAIKNNTGADFTMTGGTINAVYMAIENYYNNTVTMTGGTLDVARDDGARIYGIYCAYYCEISLEGNSNINLHRKTSSGRTDWVIGAYQDYGLGKLTLKDNVTISTDGTNNSTSFDDFNVTIEDNVVITSYSTNRAIGGYTSGTVNIEPNSNVTVTATGYSATGFQGGAVTVNSGTITATSTGEWGRGSGFEDSSVILIDGTVTASSVLYGTAAGLYDCGGDIRGGTITATSELRDAFGVYGETSASLTMSGGSISATSTNAQTNYGGYGAYLRENNSTITGGTLYGSTYGITTASSNTVTIGVDENDGTTRPSITSPEIVGEEYGTFNGSFKFYDGVLKGGTNAYKAGTITAIPDATVYHTEIISGKENCWLVDADNYLEVAGTPYNSLKKAYDAITGSTGTIKVIANTRVEAMLPSSPANKTITFDLNGYDLIYTQTMTVGDSGTLIITDDSQSGDGTLSNPSTYVITNDGTLTIQGGTISSPDKAIKNNNNKTVTISGGTINAVNRGIDEGNYGVVTMTGGLINVANDTRNNIYGIYCYYMCSTTMSGNSSIYVGIATSSGNPDSATGFYNYYYYSDSFTMEDNASIVINTTSGRSTGIDDSTNVTLRDNASITSTTSNNSGTAYGISGAGTALTIEANSNVQITVSGLSSTGINDSKVTMYSGTISASSYADYQYWGALGVGIQDGSLTLIDGTINASNTGGVGYAYGVTGGSMYYGIANIQGGTITATNDNGASYGIYGQGSDRYNISGGTITSTSTNGNGVGATFNNEYAVITGGTIKGNAYGIVGGSNNYAITLGENEGGTPSTTSPVIIGGSYGLYEGLFNFYDGIVKGGIDYFNNGDIVSSVATGAALAFGTDTIDGATYQTAYLTPEYNVAEINGTGYKRLSDAITAAGTNDTIDLIATNYLFENITIPSGKEFTIDTNGYQIISGRTITNNGKVKLTNSSAASQNPAIVYRKTSNVFITNTGELEIEKIPITAANVITSNNKLTLTDTILNATSTAVANTAGGTVTLNHATINSNNIGINSAGTVTNTTRDNSNITATNYAIYSTDGSVTMNGASLTGKTAYYQYSNTTLGTIANDTINGSIASWAGTINISDSTITESGTSLAGAAVANNSPSNMTIQDTTINYTTLNTDNDIMAVYNNNTMSLDNVDMNFDISGWLSDASYGINNEGSQLDAVDVNIVYNIHDKTGEYSYDRVAGYGIRNTTGNLNYRSGSILLENRIKSYGIYNTTGEVTIGTPEDPNSGHYGDPDADVSTTNPSIYVVGSTIGYGVKNESGRVNFYDGIITGSSHPMPDMPAIPTKTEYHFEARLFTDADNYQYLILKYIQS